MADGEFGGGIAIGDNAGGMMSVDETLMCSFQILKPSGMGDVMTIFSVT